MTTCDWASQEDMVNHNAGAKRRVKGGMCQGKGLANKNRRYVLCVWYVCYVLCAMYYMLCVMCMRYVLWVMCYALCVLFLVLHVWCYALCVMCGVMRYVWCYALCVLFLVYVLCVMCAKCVLGVCAMYELSPEGYAYDQWMYVMTYICALKLSPREGGIWQSANRH